MFLEKLAYWILIIAMGVTAAGWVHIIYYWMTARYIVEDVFLIYKDGRIVTHITQSNTSQMDKELLAGMLTATEMFMCAAFKKISERDDEFRRMGYGSLQVILKRGGTTYLAVLIRGYEKRKLLKIISKVHNEIENNYESFLQRWNGERKKDIIEKINEHLKYLLHSG